MMIYGRSTKKTINKLKKKLGSGVYDAGFGLCSNMGGQQNNLIVVKLQGTYTFNTELGASDITCQKSFWCEFDNRYMEIKEMFKDSPVHKFTDDEISFDQWMEWYNNMD